MDNVDNPLALIRKLMNLIDFRAIVNEILRVDNLCTTSGRGPPPPEWFNGVKMTRLEGLW